ncbi:MAG: RecX family transcriptional regulator [Actinobacteria bacterium 13_2_20CM_2_71_6]|nr:MAG: RecX family transcriptional regulator [Actinobacteria bacterium 13_2_20CM_2_71_6]
MGRGRDGGLGRGGWDRGTESGRRAKARTARARDTEDDESRDPAELAREICLRQLGVRPRTRAELAKVLRKQGIADEVAAEVLDRYDEVGLIDDEAFARAWVTSRHHGRGLARRALAGELRQRGVDGEVVGAALEELDPATEAATARELVERKLRSMGKAAPEVAFRRLVGLLARKGYSAGLAVTVVKDAMAATRDQTGDRELAAFVEVVNPDALTDLIGEPDASFTGETEAHGS